MQTVECILLNLKNKTRFRMCSFTRIHRKTSVPESFLIFSFNFFFNRFLFLFLLKKHWHMCFLVNFAEFLRLLFLQNTSGLLLLEGQIKKDQFINHLIKSLKNLANKCWSTVPPATSAEDFSKGISPSFQTIKIKNELVQANINANVGNSVVSADKNKENVNNQLELVIQYQHKKYQSRSGLNYDIEVNKWKYTTWSTKYRK